MGNYAKILNACQPYLAAVQGFLAALAVLYFSGPSVAGVLCSLVLLGLGVGLSWRSHHSLTALQNAVAEHLEHLQQLGEASVVKDSHSQEGLCQREA